MAPMKEAFVGCLLGHAVGDAIGLPYEGLSPRRAAKLLGAPDRHRFFRGRGMVSDDTEHACFVAEALIDALGDPEVFERRLARSLRWWLLGLPAGIGFATLRSVLKLWLGFPPTRSGVFSAGNGPAMRSGLLGVAYGHDTTILEDLVRRSTRITHTDPDAYRGALTVALAAHWSARGEGVRRSGASGGRTRAVFVGLRHTWSVRLNGGSEDGEYGSLGRSSWWSFSLEVVQDMSDDGRVDDESEELHFFPASTTETRYALRRTFPE